LPAETLEAALDDAEYFCYVLFMPTRILFYYPYNQTMTGGARTVLNLTDRMEEERGISPVFVSQNENPLVHEMRRRAAEVHVVPFPPVLDVYDKGALSYSLKRKLQAGAAVASYNRRIAGLIRRCDVQAVWARGTKGVLMTAPAARWNGLPMIWSIGLEQQAGAFMRLLRGTALCAATDVVTQARRQPEAIFGRPVAQLLDRKFHAIYPGVDEERQANIRKAARRARSGLVPRKEKKDGFEVLCVASVHPRKNQLMLLRALRELVSTHPQVRVRLAGTVADEAYAARLRSFVEAEGLEANVQLLGWRDDVPELMGTSDVLVLCSHAEGIPHVIREAMHAELPAVGTRVGGVPEVIHDDETGFLVDVGDVDSLRDRLAHLIGRPEELRRMGRNARRRAENVFSQEAWKAQYCAFLRKKAGANPQSRP
jgi:glycosyltransferase involved in cell wall biosynthesis